MKKKICIGIVIILIIIIVAGIITNYADSTRVRNGHEPKYCIKVVSYDGSKVTYWGLGYKVIRYVGVSPNELFESNIGVKMGNWFMIYELPKSSIMETEYEGTNNNTSQDQCSFVGTILEETMTYMIVEPNEDEVARKSSDKIIVNYGTDNKDYLYGIGRKVVINYNGFIKETYPAQIDTNNISVQGYKDFTLSVKTSNNKKKTKVINNNEIYKDNLDFDLYYYGLDEVNVTVKKQTIPLLDALKSGKITIDGIIAKANQDLQKPIYFDDGGSVVYQYENYTIIKCHTLDGNRDVYIGTKNLTLNDVI